MDIAAPAKTDLWNIEQIAPLFNATSKHIDDIEEDDGYEFQFKLQGLDVLLSFVPSASEVLVALDDGKWYLEGEGHKRPVLRGKTLTLTLDTLRLDIYSGDV